MAAFQKTQGREIRRDDGAAISPDGKGWDEYVAWRAEGNTPDELDPVVTSAPVPTLEARVAELERLIGQLIDTGK